MVIQFFYNLMTEYTKKNWENYPKIALNREI